MEIWCNGLGGEAVASRGGVCLSHDSADFNLSEAFNIFKMANLECKDEAEENVVCSECSSNKGVM